MKAELTTMTPLERCQNALPCVQDALCAVFGRNLIDGNPNITVEIKPHKVSSPPYTEIPDLKIDGWIFIAPTIKEPLVKRKMIGGGFRPASPVWGLTTGLWTHSGHRDEPDTYDIDEVETDGSLGDAILKAVNLIAKNILEQKDEAFIESENARLEAEAQEFFAEEEKRATQADTAGEPN